MEISDQTWISKKLRDAALGLDEPHEQAKAVIFAAATLSAGMGAVPFGINMAAFVAVDTAMVAALGAIYGLHYSNEQAAVLLKKMVSTVGVTTGAYLGVAKLMAEVVKTSGVAILPFYFVGLSMDGILSGAVTYAVGFTSKTYFEKESQMSKSDMRREFRKHLRTGRGRARELSQDGPRAA